MGVQTAQAVEPATETRIERAQEVTILEAEELEDGHYRVRARNEDGEERQLLLVPNRLLSSSPDSMYRRDNGIVGKYLLALAQVHDGAREDLLEAIEEQQEDLEDDLSELQAEISERAQTFNNLTAVQHELLS